MNNLELQATCSDEQRSAIAYLRTPVAIRERCDRLFTLACANQLNYFRCNLTQVDSVADYVIEVMRDQYPDLNIPFHSRWRHFEVGNVPRLVELEQQLAGLTPLEKAQTKFDLAIVSVLLDAGAGSNWQYHEQETGLVFRRSEGLAVASFRMFCQGAFSSDPEHPLQADAQGLQALTVQKLAQGFQASSANPLVGVEGRLELLQRLGRSLVALPQLFGDSNPRPGNLVNYLLGVGVETGNWGQESSCTDIWQQTSPLFPHSSLPTQLAAKTVLSAVLEGLGNIWPGRLAIADINLGDVWLHPALQGNNPTDQYVPFHKLSQWLTYSLLEPLQELGLEITGLDELTGLPEYRNGGLCLDLGLLEVKDSAVLQDRHLPGSEMIVEWRALTVSLLDKIAVAIRQKLNLSKADLPLVKVLQGGTWTAGRKIAAQLREGGVPPIQIESDGTVF
ncbi:MAG: URC4/urg3 family protein [Coleofasciculus sp. Co-bin14]|nr:URC4/urg3 family protein [Coleofasciculus sp. Co-bin14]